MTIPVFKTEDEEAEFWDKHSPLDFILEPTPETIKVKIPKDRVITIRLDRKSLLKLDRIAREHNVGPSTFARLIIMSALKYLSFINSEEMPRLRSSTLEKHNIEE